MAIDYTELFTHIGKIIEKINSYEALADTTLPTDMQEILDAIQTDDRDAVSEGLVTDYNSFRSDVTRWRNRLATYITKRFQDPTIISELNLDTTAINVVLPAFMSQMAIDGEAVEPSTVTIGSVTPVSTNYGNGTVLTTKILDGFSAPGGNLPAHPDYNYRASELAVPSETMTIRCTGDSQNDGRTEGQESFTWHGDLRNLSLDYPTEGSGSGPTMSTLNASTLVSNRDFETFTSNAPASWDIDSGVAGTTIFQETLAANVYRGSSSLEFLGNSATSTIQISQTLPVSTLRPLRRYCLAVRYKASSAGGTTAFFVQLQGTGYSPTIGEKIQIDSASYATSWTLAYFFVNMPRVIPSDLEIAIKVTGTLETGRSLFVDSLAFGPVTWHGGVGAVVVAGNDRFMRGDQLGFTVANNQAGTFQDFFRRYYGRMLPSSSSSPISDSLAT